MIVNEHHGEHQLVSILEMDSDGNLDGRGKEGVWPKIK